MFPFTRYARKKKKGISVMNVFFKAPASDRKALCQRPLELAVHGGQEPDKEINEGQGKEGTQA